MIQNSYSKNNLILQIQALLNPTTGLFTIIDHFFETGERLIYEPGATFQGISVTGIATAGGTLPSEVYAIRKSKDTLQLATSRANALSGANVAFTSTGSGNAHSLEMFKKNEKGININRWCHTISDGIYSDYI